MFSLACLTPKRRNFEAKTKKGKMKWKSLPTSFIFSSQRSAQRKVSECLMRSLFNCQFKVNGNRANAP